MEDKVLALLSFVILVIVSQHLMKMKRMLKTSYSEGVLQAMNAIVISVSLYSSHFLLLPGTLSCDLMNDYTDERLHRLHILNLLS